MMIFINWKKNKQKVLNFMLISTGTSRTTNALKVFPNYLKDNIQNQTISKLCIDDNKSKHSSNSTDILKSIKKFYEKPCTKDTIFKVAITEFISKILYRKKTSSGQFHFFEAKISLN